MATVDLRTKKAKLCTKEALQVLQSQLGKCEYDTQCVDMPSRLSCYHCTIHTFSSATDRSLKAFTTARVSVSSADESGIEEESDGELLGKEMDPVLTLLLSSCSKEAILTGYLEAPLTAPKLDMPA